MEYASAEKPASVADAERSEERRDSGLTYGRGGPAVEVLVRRRPGQYLLSDEGRAVELAGRPPGWFEVAQAVVRDHSLNLNRRGVVSVPAVSSRPAAWRDALAASVADASLALYEALLELDA
jgi:hypothetical protein